MKMFIAFASSSSGRVSFELCFGSVWFSSEPQLMSALRFSDEEAFGLTSRNLHWPPSLSCCWRYLSLACLPAGT